MSDMKSIFCETLLRGKGFGYIGITSRGNHGKTEQRFDSSLAYLFVPAYLFLKKDMHNSCLSLIVLIFVSG